MKNIQKLLFIFSLFLLLYSCETAPHASADEKKNDFLITHNRIGPIKRDMSAKDLYKIFPADQIQRIKTKTELTATPTDNYYIYNAGNRLLLIANTATPNDERSRISRIIVKDTQFVTEKGIRLGSDVGEIREAYENTDFIPSANEIVLSVPEINANFEVDTRNLPTEIWIDSTGVADENISDTIRTTALAIFWKPGKASIITKTFWHDLLHKIFNWSITQLPPILLLILIFIGLLRLLGILVKRIRSIALRRTARREPANNTETDKKINTLSDIIYGTGKILLWTVFLLIILGKLNINIAPILASAGIVGLAVGFGAQELVRDFISGFFMLLEDEIRAGDVVIINGTSGTVEKIELRTTTLRDASGVVHIFQNGKINTLSNMTKEWSAMVVEIGVAYKEDTDHVSAVMKQVGDDMLKDSVYGEKLLKPVEIWGVDQFADSAVILKVKITTKAGEQWSISREYRRRIKKAFDAHNIEIPFPHLSLYAGSVTKPMPIGLKEQNAEK